MIFFLNFDKSLAFSSEAISIDQPSWSLEIDSEENAYKNQEAISIDQLGWSIEIASEEKANDWSK